MDKKELTAQEQEQAKREAEEIANDIVKLPRKFRDMIAGAVSFAQLATAEKAG